MTLALGQESPEREVVFRIIAIAKRVRELPRQRLKVLLARVGHSGTCDAHGVRDDLSIDGAFGAAGKTGPTRFGDTRRDCNSWSSAAALGATLGKNSERCELLVVRGHRNVGWVHTKEGLLFGFLPGCAPSMEPFALLKEIGTHDTESPVGGELCSFENIVSPKAITPNFCP